MELLSPFSFILSSEVVGFGDEEEEEDAEASSG
jgi:hypothetical protein